MLREANTRLKSSANIRKGGKNLSELPLVLVVGESGATKTTAVLNSGLDPELLSGQASQDGTALPTPAVNVWLAADTTFVEAGGPVVNDASAWSRLVDLLRARGLANLLGRTAQSPRAVVLCVDASALANAQAAAAVTGMARKYNAALGDVAQRWGNRLPIYVLLTKTDQIPYFSDYVRNLTQDQVTAVFGATLPLASAGGSYNEQETRRLTDAFESLFLSLADKRLEQLRRENDPSKLPGIYEFPREFRKLRDNVVRFLLDVGRPSQLRASAFLRGFYFIGVRPIVAEGLPAPMPAARPVDAGATRIFSGGAAEMAAQAMAARAPSTRRVPQWVFVRQFFSDVLLQDRAARGTSGANTRASGARRWLLACATLLCLIWIIGTTVSWSRNRALIERAKTASKALAAGALSPGQPLSLDQLKQLDEIRQVTAQVSDYERDGAPLSYRWGLYPGHSLYEDVRSLYCRDLGRTMLGPARASMQSTLTGLRAVPGPNDDYERAFNTLKAYLMTTSNPEKAEVPFLGDQLSAQYAGGRQLAPEQAALVRDQFAYYAAERSSGMCPAADDKDAVEQARTHLWNYPLVERTYRNIINDVSKKNPSVSYVDPSGTGSLVDPYVVAGAFTRKGWGAVKQAMAQSSGGEAWVLGPERRGATAISSAELQQGLRQKYTADYISQWNNYLDKGNVTAYANFPDAAKKLDAMTNSKSSLLALVCLASVNTAVDSPEIAKAFSGVQQLVPPATCIDRPIDAAAQQYMQALGAIHVRVSDIADKPDASGESIDSTAARLAARTTTQSLNLPAKVDKLLNDPILHADQLLQAKAPEALNAKGAEFCQQAKGVLGKFPFNPNGREDAKPDEVGAFFAPQNGMLAKFFQESLQDVLVPSGSGYAPKTGSKFKLNGAFLGFMNRAAWISRILYGASPVKAGFTYTVQPLTSPGIENFQLSVAGKTLTATGGGGTPAEFPWTGDSDTLKLNAKAMTGSIQPVEERGSWAIFHFLSHAEDPSAPTGVYDFRLQSSFGRQTQASSTQAILKLKATVAGNPLWFGTTCVGKIAQ